MSKKQDVLVIDGIVESLPNAMFHVKIEGKHLVLAHVSGKMRMHYIKLLPGDRVAVELSPLRFDEGTHHFALSLAKNLAGIKKDPKLYGYKEKRVSRRYEGETAVKKNLW